MRKNGFFSPQRVRHASFSLENFSRVDDEEQLTTEIERRLFGVPEDTWVLFCQYNAQLKCIDVYLAHPSYSLIHPGQDIPMEMRAALRLRDASEETATEAKGETWRDRAIRDPIFL